MKNKKLNFTENYLKNVKAEKDKIKKDRIEANKIDVVVIEFSGMSNLWFHKAQWDAIGGYKKFLKDFCLSIRDISQVNYKRVHFSKFPTTEWEG